MKKFNKKNLVLDCDSDDEEDSILGNSFSCEIGSDGLKFMKENLQVDSKGIRNIETGELLANINPNDLKFGRILGKGASGYVQEVEHKITGLKMALKSINVYERDKRHQLMNDIRGFMNTASPFLVKFYCAYYHEGMVKLALELMDLGSIGSLIKLISGSIVKIPPPRTLIPEIILTKLTQQMVNGLLYLHKVKKQVHRDIKPDNILLNSAGEVKLSDFGICKELDSSAILCNTFVGTATYMSPERIEGQTYSYDSDIWSLGLVLIEMATGTYPYPQAKTYIEQLEYIRSTPPPQLDPALFSPEFLDFISKCLQKEPKNRGTIGQLCAHPWILQYSQYDVDLLAWIKYVKQLLLNK